MRRFKTVLKDQSGIAAVEFGLIASALLGLMLAIAELGAFYFATTGLKSAVAEGARLATTYPRPTDAQISARIAKTQFGLQASKLSPATFTHGTTSGRDHVDIRMTYNAQIKLFFIPTKTITLVEQRRAYIHPL